MSEPRSRRPIRTASLGPCALLTLAACFVPTVANAAIPMNYYCMANAQQAHTRYLTGIFSATAEKRDVINAWAQYLESQHIDAGQSLSCDSAVDVAGVKTLSDISRQSAASLQTRVVDVDWKFTPGQVQASQPNTSYGYCETGTSVASTTYFSDVFGLSIRDAMSNDYIVQFLQYVRGKYANPAGVGTGRGPGPNGEWCMLVGSVTDATRAKQAAEGNLRAGGRQIVETGWRYGALPNASATPPPTATNAQVVVAAPALAPTAGGTMASASGQAYYCRAYSTDRRYDYFTPVHALDAAQQDVISAWRKYALAGQLSGIFESNSQMGCETGTAAQTQSNLDVYRKQAEQRAKAQPAFHTATVDWKFTPDQLAVLSKPGATYGFCWYQDQVKPVKYVSAAFEMPDADMAAGNVVMFNEFAQDLRSRHGVAVGGYDPRNGACVQQGGATAADDNRIKFEAAARQSGAQVVETAWKFVRTPATPPPGPAQTGHGHGASG